MEACNDDGWNPLLTAAQEGHFPIVKVVSYIDCSLLTLIVNEAFY